MDYDPYSVKLAVSSRVRLTYRRSAAGARATAEPARRRRLLQRLVGRRSSTSAMSPPEVNHAEDKADKRTSGKHRGGPEQEHGAPVKTRQFSSRTSADGK